MTKWNEQLFLAGSNLLNSSVTEHEDSGKMRRNKFCTTLRCKNKLDGQMNPADQTIFESEFYLEMYFDE